MATFAVEEKPFRLRPRANKRAGRDEISIWSRAGRSVMRIVRLNVRKPKASSGKGAKKTVALANRSGRVRNQRVAVRVTYAPNLMPGHWKAHGRYIARDSASQPTKDLPPGFGPEPGLWVTSAPPWLNGRGARILVCSSSSSHPSLGSAWTWSHTQKR